MSDFDVQDVRDLVAKQTQDSPKGPLRGVKSPSDSVDLSPLMHIKDAKEQRQRLGLPPQPGPSNAAGGAGAPPPPPPAAV